MSLEEVGHVRSKSKHGVVEGKQISCFNEIFHSKLIFAISFQGSGKYLLLE